jgi:hypothetical protein
LAILRNPFVDCFIGVDADPVGKFARMNLDLILWHVSEVVPQMIADGWPALPPSHESSDNRDQGGADGRSNKEHAKMIDDWIEHDCSR